MSGNRRCSPPRRTRRCCTGSAISRQHVRLQVYAHELESREAVVEWVRGSLLTDYERRLPAELWPRFLERYRERLLPQLEDTRPFFYPFKRVLLWGAR